MAPHSPGTDQIDSLLWIGFIAATIIVVAVNVALLYALRRKSAGNEARQLTGGRRLQFRVAGLLTVVAAVLFVTATVFTTNARETPETGPAGLQAANEEKLEIRATGQQWIWRYDYPNQAFSYYKLVVPVDTTVTLDLGSIDVVHTWDVPALAGKKDAVPGKHSKVVFRADKEGYFEGFSATLSGQGYGPMRTAVEVVSPDEYEAFIERTKNEIQEAQDRAVEEFGEGATP